jgi:chemotaxis protein MotA
MDIASAVGFILAVCFMAVGVVMGGGSAGAFIDVPSLIVAVGGSVAAVTVCFPLRAILKLPKAAVSVFLNAPADIKGLVDLLVRLAETARREGLLTLENSLSDIDNPFIVLGLQMTVDGTQPEVIENILRTEMEEHYQRQREAKAVFEQWGKLGPAFGMIGTLVGLILMLRKLDDPSQLGPGMALAMITTLYGALLANVLCIPFAEKLNYLLRQEMQVMEITIRGVLSIQAGESPRVLQQKLSVYLPRNKSQEEAAIAA